MKLEYVMVTASPSPASPPEDVQPARLIAARVATVVVAMSFFFM